MSDRSSSFHASRLTPHGLSAFAVSPPGFEDLVAGELNGLGFSGVRVVPGGVEFQGGWSEVYRANLFSRVASRILVRVARFEARTFHRLAAGFAAVSWAEWLPAGCVVELRAVCRKSRLYHSGRVREELAAALAATVGARRGDPKEQRLRLQVRLEHDRVEVSLDTSGQHLHRRGYRDHVGPAPLRENLAAGLLLRAGWTGDEALLDPCCGSGTFPVEAALLAVGIAPGRDRRFAFQGLPSFDPREWNRVSARVGPQPPFRTPPHAPVLASDRDARALQLTARAVRRAGVADAVQVARAEVAELEVPCGSGLLVANPPYGRRLGHGGEAYRALGRVLRGPLRGWRWAVVVPGPEARSALGLVASASHPFRNGGIRLRFEVGAPHQTTAGHPASRRR